MLMGLLKRKNDYATKAILDSKINDLKDQHISDEVKKVNDKVKKNITDISNFKSPLDQEKSTIDNLEREISYFRGKDYYFNSWYRLNLLLIHLQQEQIHYT